MKTFDFEVSFLMSCVTRGYTITAKDKDDAQRKISECIDKDGAFDFKKFEDTAKQYCEANDIDASKADPKEARL